MSREPCLFSFSRDPLTSTAYSSAIGLEMNKGFIMHGLRG